jgi:hypothetical protein
MEGVFGRVKLDGDGNKFDWTWRHVRSLTFETMMYLQKNTLYNTMNYWQHLLWAAHAGALICSPYSTVPWSPRVTKTFSTLLEVLSLYPTQWGQPWLLLAFVTLILGSAVFLFGLTSSHLKDQRPVPWLLTFGARFAMGTVLFFQLPLFRAILNLVFCDAHQSDATATAYDFAGLCMDTAASKAHSVIAMMLIPVWAVLVAISSCMFINDPRSYSFAARPHARYELCVIVVHVITSSVVALAPRSGLAHTITSFLLQCSLLAGVIVFQPFYWSNFNHFVAAARSVVATVRLFCMFIFRVKFV